MKHLRAFSVLVLSVILVLTLSGCGELGKVESQAKLFCVAWLASSNSDMSETLAASVVVAKNHVTQGTFTRSQVVTQFTDSTGPYYILDSSDISPYLYSASIIDTPATAVMILEGAEYPRVEFSLLKSGEVWQIVKIDLIPPA